MRKLHTTLYLGLTIFVTLFLIFMAVFFFKIIKNKNEHTLAVVTTLEDRITEKKNKDLLIKKFDYINNTHKLVRSHFVDPTKIDDFVGYLEKLGEDNQAKLSVKNVQAAEKKDNNKISVEILIEGSFPSIMKTIAQLENTPYQIAIDSSYINKDLKLEKDIAVKIESPVATTWQANVSFSILSLK